MNVFYIARRRYNKSNPIFTGKPALYIFFHSRYMGGHIHISPPQDGQGRQGRQVLPPPLNFFYHFDTPGPGPYHMLIR